MTKRMLIGGEPLPLPGGIRISALVSVDKTDTAKIQLHRDPYSARGDDDTFESFDWRVQRSTALRFSAPVATAWELGLAFLVCDRRYIRDAFGRAWVDDLRLRFEPIGTDVYCGWIMPYADAYGVLQQWATTLASRALMAHRTSRHSEANRVVQLARTTLPESIAVAAALYEMAESETERAKLLSSLRANYGLRADEDLLTARAQELGQVPTPEQIAADHALPMAKGWKRSVAASGAQYLVPESGYPRVAIEPWCFLGIRPRDVIARFRTFAGG